MRQILLIISVLIFATSFAYAGDVWVNGYYRSDGTYVRGHHRSSPDSYKWNNYGPSRSESDRLNPYGRDNDGDGTPNYLDMDDDNDGLHDDYDSNQYGSSYRWLK